MRYKEFMENNNRKSVKRTNFTNQTINRGRNSNNTNMRFNKTVKVSNGKEMGKSIFHHIKGLESNGLKVVGVVFSIFSGVITVGFKVLGDAIGFVGGNLQMLYRNSNSKNQDRLANSLVVGAIAFLVMVGVTIKVNSDNKVLANKIEEISTEKEEAIEVDIKDKATLVENTAENTTENTSENKIIKTVQSKVTTTLDNSLKDISFKKMDGDLTTNTIDVRYKDKTTGKIVKITSKAYGLAGLTTVENKKCVTDFIKYIKEVDSEFYKEYFEGVDAPGTVTFDTGWYSATKTEKEKFNLLQMNYIYNKYVSSTVDFINVKYGIDLMSTKALKEFAFRTAYDYGKEGTAMLFENASINSSMSEKEIIEKIQQEKINSLGTYTYMDEWLYTDSDREEAKSVIIKELEGLLKLI